MYVYDIGLDLALSLARVWGVLKKNANNLVRIET